MQTHSPNCLEGPISGSRPWWRALDVADRPEPMFRAGLVEQIRREIAAGAYDTPEKWDIALERLLKRLDRSEE